MSEPLHHQLGTAAADLEPAPSIEAAFERLEYGKLCTSPDGPIEAGGEAYALARSPRFPADLVPLCHPARLGIGGDLPEGIPEGWVVRSIRHGGSLRPLACRLRHRPEDGEHGGRRRYWLARYLYCRDAADPLSCFRALSDAPLQGITVQQARASWTAVVVRRPPAPAADGLLSTFLRQAVAYAASAVPIGISPGIAEEDLFAWAAALRALLPAGLQPAFAAAWGIAAHETAAVNLSFSPAYSPAVAIFDLESRSWRRPTARVALSAAGEQPEPWSDRHLIPGSMYLREAFSWGADGQPILDAAGDPPSSRGAYLADLDLGLDGPEASAVIDLRLPWIAEWFTRPGWRSLDEARLGMLASWCADPAAADPAGLCTATADYFTPAARRRVLALGLTALERATPRGDRILWTSLLEDPEAHDALLGAAPAGRLPARARLLAALARGDVAATLEALAAAAPEAGWADDLPAAAADRLETCLDQSLDRPEIVGLHAGVLCQAPVAGPYRLWVEGRARQLAFTLARSAPGAGTLRALAGLLEAPFVAWIAAWRQGLPPQDSDAAVLDAMDPGLRQDLALLLLDDWEFIAGSDAAGRRETLVPWLRLVGAPAGRVVGPLARICLEGAALQLHPNERPELKDAIHQNGVPASLVPRLAAVVLRAWYFFEPDHHEQVPGWRSLVGEWPADVRLALLGDAGPASDRDIDPEVSAAVTSALLSCPLLDRLLAAPWRTRRRDELARLAADRLWEWCRRTEPYGLSAPDLCRVLAVASWPEGEPDEAVGAVEKAASLARQVRFFELRPDRLPVLWSQAARGWQLQLLLWSAPATDIRPSRAQLAALVPRRRWLSEHVKQRGVEPARQRRFELAILDFHARAYDQPGGLWHDELSKVALWAAFSGVPFALQGDLAQALTVYSQGCPDVEARKVQLARRYLEPFRKSKADRRDAVRRIAQGLLLPLAQDAALNRNDLAMAALAVLGGGSRRRRDASPWPTGPKQQPRAFEPSRERIFIAPWLVDFLSAIQSCGGGDALLEALR